MKRKSTSSNYCACLSSPSITMASPIQDPGLSSKPYIDPTPMPADVPKVNELGATSAPLKSAAFFIGAFCKEYNGAPAFSCSTTMIII